MTDSLFAQQGAPYGNFKSPGTNYQGTIVRLGQVQSQKFVPPNQRAAGKQGELEFWPDGKPKMTAIITVQTTLRDPSIVGDDGQRSVWVKGKNMTDAVKAALRQAGAARRGLEVGGFFSMTFTFQDAEPEFEGGTPAKHYEVEYDLPENNRLGAVVPQDAPLVAPGTPVANQAPQAAQQAQGAQNGPPQAASTGTYAAAPAPAVQDAAVVGGVDTSGMSPEVVAALQALMAQQGGQQ